MEEYINRQFQANYTHTLIANTCNVTATPETYRIFCMDKTKSTAPSITSTERNIEQVAVVKCEENPRDNFSSMVIFLLSITSDS